jgi:glycosyltransferase involved in cell wall biosynthesis
MTIKALNIALLIDSRNYGGIETHVVNLAKGLDKLGHKVQIILLNDYGQHPVFESEELLRSMLVKLDGKLATFYRFIQKSNINLVHTHGYKAGIIGRLSCKLASTTVISTFHSGEKGNAKMRFYRWLDRITVQSTACICVSEEIKTSARLNAKVIDNFIDLPSTSDKNNEIASQIAFVGRLSIEKGPDVFLHLAKQLPQYNFSMYGSGPMEEEINHAASNNVALMGHVASMDQHWPKIKFLCITSREEGLPLVAIEALVRGIPVISFDIGGISSVVINNHNGWLIPPFDLDAFIESINHGQALSAAQREQMSSMAYSHIKNNFSSDVIIPKICSVYLNALIGEDNAQQAI